MGILCIRDTETHGSAPHSLPTYPPTHCTAHFQSDTSSNELQLRFQYHCNPDPLHIYTLSDSRSDKLHIYTFNLIVILTIKKKKTFLHCKSRFQIKTRMCKHSTYEAHRKTTTGSITSYNGKAFSSDFRIWIGRLTNGQYYYCYYYLHFNSTFQDTQSALHTIELSLSWDKLMQMLILEIVHFKIATLEQSLVVMSCLCNQLQFVFAEDGTI